MHFCSGEAFSQSLGAKSWHEVDDVPKSATHRTTTRACRKVGKAYLRILLKDFESFGVREIELDDFRPADIESD